MDKSLVHSEKYEFSKMVRKVTGCNGEKRLIEKADHR